MIIPWLLHDQPCLIGQAVSQPKTGGLRLGEILSVRTGSFGHS